MTSKRPSTGNTPESKKAGTPIDVEALLREVEHLREWVELLEEDLRKAGELVAQYSRDEHREQAALKRLKELENIDKLARRNRF